MNKVKIGLIGAGQMACGAFDVNIAGGHLGTFKHIDDIELVAVADLNKDNLEKFKVKNFNPGTKYYRSHTELLKEPEIEAVIVATPDFTHVDIVVDALAADKHVLSEKPAATSLIDLSRLEKAVNASSKIYQVGLECRYIPFYQHIKKMLDRGDLGIPRMFWFKEFRPPFLEKTGNWILFNDKTGGVFVEKTCHFFDLFNWYAGSRPVKVIASAGQDVVKEIYGVKPDVFDNGFVIVEYENGIRANLALCMFLKGAETVEIGIIGDEGKLEGNLNPAQLTFCSFADNTYSEVNVKTDPVAKKLSHCGGVYFQHLDFIKSIRGNIRPMNNIDVAKWSTLIGLAAEESARNGGKPVEL